LCEKLKNILGEKLAGWQNVRICNRWRTEIFDEARQNELHNIYLIALNAYETGRAMAYDYQKVDGSAISSRSYAAGLDFW